ncbi:MAG: cupredoxin domain-containing protein [Acidimicrobiales bacterium]
MNRGHGDETEPTTRVLWVRVGGALLALAIGGAALSGCGEEGEDGDGDTSHATDESATHGDAPRGEPSPVPDDARHVPVTARSFAFEPDQVTAETGEPIAIVLTAEDAVHDFVIDEVDAHVSAETGETVVGGFEAPAPGRYVSYGTIAGDREAGMEGTLVVEAAR